MATCQINMQIKIWGALHCKQKIGLTLGDFAWVRDWEIKAYLICTHQYLVFDVCLFSCLNDAQITNQKQTE